MMEMHDTVLDALTAELGRRFENTIYDRRPDDQLVQDIASSVPDTSRSSLQQYAFQQLKAILGMQKSGVPPFEAWDRLAFVFRRVPDRKASRRLGRDVILLIWCSTAVIACHLSRSATLPWLRLGVVSSRKHSEYICARLLEQGRVNVETVRMLAESAFVRHDYTLALQLVDQALRFTRMCMKSESVSLSLPAGDIQLWLAFSLDVQSPVLKARLGLLHLRMRQFGPASSYLNEAYQQLPTNPSVIAGLHVLAFIRSDWQQADTFLRELLLLEPGNQFAAEQALRLQRTRTDIPAAQPSLPIASR